MMPDNHLLYSNMEGRTLKIGANNAAPLFSFESVTIDGVTRDQFSGIDLSILKTLSAVLNFTFEIQRSIDNTWGDLQDNGKATGVIGMVYRDEIDVALAHMTITKTRAMAADFTHLYYQDTISILSQAPSISNRTFAVFSPFQPMVWALIILATLFLCLILKTLSMVTESRMGQTSTGSLQVISFNVFRTIINQGNLISVSLWSHRCIFFAWYSFCMIIYALYSGTLIAVLAIPSYEKPVDSLTDLPWAVLQEGYTLGTSRMSMMEFLFKYATEGIYKETWALFNHEDRDQSFIRGDTAYEEVLKREKFLYIGPTLRAHTEALRHGREKFHIGKDSFSSMWIGYACARGAPFKKEFNRLILRILQAGLIIKWKDDELRKMKKARPGKAPSRQRPIKLIYMQAAFYVLLLGYTVSTFTFLLERFH
ncbi:glutamate receptor ionotropic, delta-2-like [Palaemon carinicauda]|uniref:glutamate receptor ionotropic, delta-2-like n=1 Tax=Palaemon carinicauda TaxID=392227 RepID=UPI0035B5DFFE